MGAGFHGGFGNTDGTKSNETNKLIKELESNGVKFSKEEYCFYNQRQNRTDCVVRKRQFNCWT